MVPGRGYGIIMALVREQWKRGFFSFAKEGKKDSEQKMQGESIPTLLIY